MKVSAVRRTGSEREKERERGERRRERERGERRRERGRGSASSKGVDSLGNRVKGPHFGGRLKIPQLLVF